LNLSLEDNIGMIAASAPILKPLVSRFIGLESTKDRGYQQYGSNGNGQTGKSKNNTGLRSNAHDRAFARAEAGYELDDHETESDGASQASNMKKRDSVVNTLSLYPHDNGSMETILQQGRFNTVTVGKSSLRPQLQSTYKGITRTMEVRIE
jgi:hypothetical protein